MTYQNKSLIFLFFLFVLAAVAPWTIDLPEVRKKLFEEHEKHKKYESDYKNYINDDQEFYSNAEGNSKHNSDHVDKYYDTYAKEFEHKSYMEKKVVDIVRDGGAYLEGLRRSLEEYNRFLQECNRQNMSTALNSTIFNSTLPFYPNQPNMTMFNVSNPQLQNFNTSIWSTIMQGNNSTKDRMSCREATEASEKVRRYAELAIWTTKRLQDLAYAKEYQKIDYYEENELTLKLAWFLDQLAILTGYEPDYRQYIGRRTTTSTTTSPTPMTLVPQTQELNKFLMRCIQMNSSVPATVRCAYPLPLPPGLAEMIGASSTPSPQPDINETNGVAPISPVNNIPQQPMELLITSDSYRTPRRIIKRSPIPDEFFVPVHVHDKPKPVVDFIVKKLTNLKEIVKSVKKNAVADFTSQLAYHKHLHKRAIEDDTSVLLNRLSNSLNVKPVTKDESNDRLDRLDEPTHKTDKPTPKSDEPTHKSDKPTETPDNPIIQLNKSIINVVSPKQFPVLDASVVNTKSFKKRSVDDLLSKLTTYYLKHKVWSNSNPVVEENNEESNLDVNNNLKPKIINKRSIFHKKNRLFKSIWPLQILNLHKHKHSVKNGKSKLQLYLNNVFAKKQNKWFKNQHKIKKRSLTYEQMYLPRIPTDPTGDISYYVKNKPGRNYNPSLTQAAQVRLALQQHFLTGNILTIQRYGSNYNPAIPNAFYAGFAKGLLDS